MQTLDRDQQVTQEPLDPRPAGADPAPSTPKRTITIGWVMRWSMALLMLGAAGIHFAAMGEHAGVSWTHGLFFGIVAWVQVVLAALLLLGPTRRAVQATILVNFAVIVVWLVSRTAGIAIGGDGTPEPVAFADVVCSAFEAAAIGLGLLVISGGIARRRVRIGAGWAMAGFVAVVVAALTSFGFTPAVVDASSGGGHSHGNTEVAAAGSGGEATADATTDATAGHTHAADGAAAAPTDLNGHEVKGVKAQDIAHEEEPDQVLDAPTREALAAQLMTARDVALRYPTVADAEAAGYRVIGGFGPGAGAHYNGGGAGFGGFDPNAPTSLIYDGTSPTSKITGLMYYAMGAAAPEGFAGPNDHWHRHSNICISGRDVLFPPDSEVTAQQCKDAGGYFMTITGWMVHAWVVPGWESPAGVFSHENANVRCLDGTFDTDEVGRCQGT